MELTQPFSAVQITIFLFLFVAVHLVLSDDRYKQRTRVTVGVERQRRLSFK